MSDMPDNETRREMYEKGIAMRKQVLGEQHVERSLSQATDFSRPIQEFVTEFCWGAVWTGGDLEPKVRSLLNLVMLTALNRPHELGVHVRGALRNGVTKAEIQAALLQTAVYVGAPAALDSFRIAERAINEYEETDT